MSDRDLTTANGVGEALETEEAVYESARKALLTAHQGRRRKLRALLAVLEDEEADLAGRESLAQGDDL